MLKPSLLACLFLLLLHIASAQEFFFHKFEEEFPSRPVNDILVDQKGFLWIGTDGAGLHRFDGYTYENFVFDWNDSSSINSNFIISLAQDQKNTLWIGSQHGLCKYDQKFETIERVKIRYQQNPGTEFFTINSILSASNGEVYLGLIGNGIIRLDSAEIDQATIDGSPFYQNLVVNDILEAENGEIFAATDHGLKTFSNDINKLVTPVFAEKESLLGVSIESFLYDNHNLWLGTSNEGLVKIENYNSHNYSISQFSFTDKRILDLAIMADGKLACATENDGLFLFDVTDNTYTQFIYQPNEQNTLESNSVWTLETYQDGKLWLGYYHRGMGLLSPNDEKFDYFNHSPYNINTLLSNSVNSIISDKEGNVLIGMDGGGIDKLNLKERTIFHLSEDNNFKGLTNKSIQTMLLDRKGDLWVGTWDNGMYHLPKGQKSFVNFNVSNSGLESNRVLDLEEDGNGNIWIATFGAGLQIFSRDKKRITQVHRSTLLEQSIYYGNIRDLLIDSNGTIWVGSTSGLFNLKTQDKDSSITFLQDILTDTLLHPSFNHVLTLYERKNGELLMGTDGAGLFSYDPKSGSLYSYNKHLDLKLSTVCAIATDFDGNIWLTGKSGIAKINERTQSVYHYSKKDGLTTNDFNYNAIFLTDDNTLLLGSLEGINIVNPEKLIVNKDQVQVYLSDLKLFNIEVKPDDEKSLLNKSLNATSEIELDHDQTVFTINYTGIEFIKPDQINFAYYLEGLESDWNYVGNQRSSTYTSLKDGNYTFKLKAANSDGVWSEDITTLKIKVLPAWYKNKLALFTYIALFLIGLYLLYIILRIRLKERQEVINERERNVQNEELTQKKLQFFTNISHEFRTPLTLILNPLSQLNRMNELPYLAKKYLVTVQRNAKRLERLIDELMDFRKLDSNKLKIHVHKIDLMNFTRGIAEYFSQEAEDNEIELEVHGDLANYWTWVDSGLVEKMLFNLLSNAFKVTSQNGIIDIRLTEVKKIMPLLGKEEVEVLRISVSDTGAGLSQDHLEKIFERFYQVEQLDKWYFSGTGIGLEVVKSFIELHKGKVEVESTVGEGTTFHLFFPMGKEHFSPQDLVSSDYPGMQQFLTTSTSHDLKEDKTNGVDLAKRCTILIVDDNTELRKFIRSELKDLYKIEIAKNGQEGLELAMRHLPDIIISDVMMPEMDGFEFCDNIKSDIKTSHIPLIMLTAKSTTEEQLEGINKGADVYMTKPFDIAVLKARINQLLKSRQLIYDKFHHGVGEVDNVENTTAVDRDFLQTILDYIHRHMNDSQLSVESIAEQVSLSRSQLYRKIKALTGLNVNEFIRRIRLEQAKKLLVSGVANINEVSFKVGFSSPSYFSKCYKEYFGVLPTKERK